MYLCECGTSFENLQKFNGHKRHCAINADVRGKTNKLKTADIVAAEKARTAIARQRTARMQYEPQRWIDEKHVCEKCGRIMTEIYASGRFCSQQYTNSRINSGPQKRSTDVKLQKC